MTTVWKYQLVIADLVPVAMPDGAEVLHVGVQDGIVCLWARVEPNLPITTRTFRVAGTGHDLGDFDLTYIDTFQLHDGMLVFHVFEVNS